ncbi:MAG TPA: YraN family protein [Dongiaceae bacterium]|nr:YraN family protein [Dongiaceae bacterium]
MSTAARHRRGRRAELLARLWLRLKLYRILAVNWRSPLGEIDIVARRGRTIVIVEVKSRRDRHRLPEAIQHRQRLRLLRAARHFLQCHPKHRECAVRFDAMLVRSLGLLHIHDAWQSDGSA